MLVWLAKWAWAKLNKTVCTVAVYLNCSLLSHLYFRAWCHPGLPSQKSWNLLKPVEVPPALKISYLRAPERPTANCFQPRPSWTTLLTWCTCYTPLCFDVWLRCCQQFVYRSAVLVYTTRMYNWTIPIIWKPFCNAHTLLRPNKKQTGMGNCTAVLCSTALYNCSLTGPSLAWPGFCQHRFTHVSNRV